MPVVGYEIQDCTDRVTAVDDFGVEICGSYQPQGHSYWQLYVTKLVAGLTGFPTPPHREQFWGNHGREDSRRWVELIAALYVMASPLSGGGSGAVLGDQPPVQPPNTLGETA